MSKFSMREDLYKLIFDKFSAEPEFLWSDLPDACIFRHYDNRKWFAIIMTVKPQVLGIQGLYPLDIINVKINPEDIYDLLQVPGILPAYHMNKKHWITVILDGRVNMKALEKLLDKSYELTQKKLRKATKIKS